jgi:cobaltochelatase CobN
MTRHGARGAAELAETVDRLADFAETTGAVSSTLFDLVHEAYLADPQVREFLMRENPAAAELIAERLEAMPQGRSAPHDLGTQLAALCTEALP